jgi:hypothetical protein
LIIEQKEKTIELFDDVIKEFDNLEGPTVENRGYATMTRLELYRNNVGVILCKWRAMSKFIEKSLMAFKFFVSYKEIRADRTIRRLESAKQHLDPDCHKGRHKKWKST